MTLSDEDPRTVKDRIDEARRQGKRSFLRQRQAAEFTVDDIAWLLAAGSCFKPSLGSHCLSQFDEDQYDEMLMRIVGMAWPRDINLSPWEVSSGHRRTPCRWDHICTDGCNNCNLYICSLCGGSEGSLLPYCLMRQLSQAEDEANYAHYCAGTGPFASASFKNLTEAVERCEERWRTYKTPGSEALYHAVWHLWNRTEAGPLPEPPA